MVCLGIRNLLQFSNKLERCSFKLFKRAINMKGVGFGTANPEVSDGCGFCAQTHPHLDTFVSNFFTESIIHGIQYLASSKRNIIERIFWGITILGCSAFAIHQVYDVITKYFNSPVIISFQPKETPVSDIPFPAITICNVNLLKTSVLHRIYKNFTDEDIAHGRITNPADLPPSVIMGAGILDHLAQFCLAAPSFRRKMKERLLDPMGREDFISGIQNGLARLNESFNEIIEKYYQRVQRKVAEIFQEATLNCEDMILSCIWGGNPIPCSEHFFRLDTRSGRCCVFNMMPKYILQNIPYSRDIDICLAILEERRAQREHDKFTRDAQIGWEEFAKKKVVIDANGAGNSEYPKYQSSGGKPYGLSLLLNPILEEYSTCTVNDGSGFKLVTHSPVSSPSIMDYAVAVPVDSEVFVDIEPHVTIADQRKLSGIEIDKRGCYLPTDPAATLMHYNFYSSENCLSECIAEQTQEKCRCVAHYMPRNASQKICGAKMLECVDKVRADVALSSGPKAHCSQCRPACTEIKYQMQMSQFTLRKNVSSAYFKYNNSNGIKTKVSNYSIIHLYFGTDSTYAKERKTLYDTNDLIANAGGLLSLALGVSIVSIVELVYFFTIRAWFELKASWEAKREEESSDSENNKRMSNGSGPIVAGSSNHSSVDYPNNWVSRGRGLVMVDTWGNNGGAQFGKNIRQSAIMQSITGVNYDPKFRRYF